MSFEEMDKTQEGMTQGRETKRGETQVKKYLVTGAAGSIGSAVTQLLAADGHTVFAGDINPETRDAYYTETVVPLSLDITDEESVRAAESEVRNLCDGLDGIINIAGIFKTGALVETEEAVFNSMLETNVAGMYRVNRVFFDLLFAKRGRIINMSSETGRFAACFNGLYSMTKYAVEAYSDALRRELQLYDMNVIIIQPGPVMTPLLLSNNRCFCEAADASRYFKPYLTKIASLVDGEQRKAAQPEAIARLIRKALYSSRPRIRYRMNNDFFRSVLAVLPPRTADLLFKIILKRMR